MRIKKVLFAIVFSLSFTGLNSAQEISDRKENWLPPLIGGYCSSLKVQFRFQTFSPDDIPNARSRFNLIKSTHPRNEWEGLYFTYAGIGDNILYWGSETGFYKSYCYHYVDRLDYGRVELKEDVIRFVTEKPIVSTLENTNSDRFNVEVVRVLFGEKHFLVPISKFRDFATLMAGRNIDSDYTNMPYFWIKREDMPKQVFGNPVVPDRQRSMIILPIKARIKRIGLRKLIPNDHSTETLNADELHIYLELSTGTKQGVETGMNFFVDDLNEWVRISRVSKDTSTGFLRRSFGQRKDEICFDGVGGYENRTPCKKIRIGMKARTKSLL